MVVVSVILCFMLCFYATMLINYLLIYFIHFGTIPVCDRQTDRQTDRWMDTRRQHITRWHKWRAAKIVYIRTCVVRPLICSRSRHNKTCREKLPTLDTRHRRRSTCRWRPVKQQVRRRWGRREGRSCWGWWGKVELPKASRRWQIPRQWGWWCWIR